ncbi:tRNA threonylcarbamoyladenosine dehydratase [Cytophagaceae bacterium DM2B3-1]|uniref:tRNA threonylcarbamoyladenosine dehydratase n=1 Tax=Xanthocytophaga flava TaxID=3048013 RepID=A0ABT7CVT6_9BACT|nr:tRNA threonylcarbamoyladenosine dehydratase [Xanthocytophaga flavus]MDJ1497830.1 tRNA threonylcarbamoyladenosine dehydratase [Xanthocytophaga flavus]
MSDLSWLSRTTLLIGDENIQKLQNAHVLIVGLGGVGSFAAEAICRAGVGTLTIADGDEVEASNRNRQLPALATTQGQYKVDIMAERMKQINPEVQLFTQKQFLQPDQMVSLLNSNYDYVLDAIDSLTPKLMLLSTAYKQGQRIVSSMGAGGKLDPTQLRVADIADTRICRLASDVRKRLRRLGIHSGIKTVYSREKHVDQALMYTDGNRFKKSAYGTISYLPAVFGMTCASVVIRDLIGWPIE